MKLDPIFARRQYESIRKICGSTASVQDKLVGKDSLSTVFRTVINTLSINASDIKTWKERVQYVLNSQDNTPGPDLARDTDNLRKDLSSYYGHYQVPGDSDYKRSVKRLSKFLAFYSDTQVPQDIVSIYENATPIASQSPMQLGVNDLIDNPTTRVPVVLCLDTSASMRGEKIDELNAGVKQFFQAVLSDDIAKYAVELCIVSFSSQAKKILDFANIERQVDSFKNVNLVASGCTAMGAAVNMSLDLLEARKKEYQDKGVDYWQPWLVLMTDGQPTDDISTAATRTADMADSKKLTIFPIGIGDGANMQRLQQFSPKREPLRLKGLMLAEFFDWLGKSVKSTSQSAPGSSVKLPPIGWAEL